MARQDEPEPLSIRETLLQLTVNDLKPLQGLVGGPAHTRKSDLVEQLAHILENPTEVRALYDNQDDLAKHAVQEATHEPHGNWDRDAFEAKYGALPALSTPGPRQYQSKPTQLRLFFPRWAFLPTDLRAILLTFVPEPPPLLVASGDELPARVRRPQVDLGDYYNKPDEEEIELLVRETARAALLDVKANLRLVDAGQVKVGEKTRIPSKASVKAIAAVLSEGDFYGEDHVPEFEGDPASDLTMKAFAWPLLLQAAGLTGTSGAKLNLTPTGRKATAKPAHEVIHQIWGRWLKTKLIDEFSRIDVIKGQRSKGTMTAVAPRREAIVEGLKGCPVGKWVRVEELFRQLKVEHPFDVSRDEYNLYLYNQEYGSFGYDSRHSWESLQGRYTLALLFEFAATLGLLDVAYISPEDARNDFRDRWGTEDITCLSRYDGLMYFRINPLGAWCLGLAEDYEPEAIDAEKVLRVLPNLDVVAAEKAPAAADVLFLERFAERKSDAVWHLGKEKVLTAVEQGVTVAELRDFLTSRSQEPLPQTAHVFLDDLEAKAGQLEDLGAARLIVCKDAIVARTLASERRLRNICQLAGERHLVFRATDEAAVRRALKELGHVLPPAK